VKDRGYRKLRPRKDLSWMLLQALCWKISDLFASVFYWKTQQSTEERISEDYLLYKIKITLKKYVREISTDSLGGVELELQIHQWVLSIP
jgi:hypothetical protein